LGLAMGVVASQTRDREKLSEISHRKGSEGMKAFPGLTKEQTAEIITRNGRTRCGKCDACLHVESTKVLAIPNPPFSHATTNTVAMWNKVLFDNPCKTWV